MRAVVCDDLANVQISGTAEGVINGTRQSVPLTLTQVDKAEAVYVVSYQWPENGSWVLHLKGSCSKPKAEASTLVPMSKGSFIREKTEVLREAGDEETGRRRAERARPLAVVSGLAGRCKVAPVGAIRHARRLSHLPRAVLHDHVEMQPHAGPCIQCLRVRLRMAIVWLTTSSASVDRSVR